MQAPPARIADVTTVPVHQLVEAQARRAPGALAVTHGAASLSYGELNGQANRLARSLRARGVRLETPVVLCMERSLELLTAFLATCKSGGTAVLLDPAWPRQRLQQAIAAVRPAVVLASRAAGGALSTDAATVPLPLHGELAGHDDGHLSVPVHPDNLAYLIYTSGSVGRPKAVGVTHRSVAHCVATHREGHRIEPGDRSSWLAPPGSSVAVGELWPYLAAGASVHVAEHATVASPVDLRDWMVATGITKTYVGMPLAELLFRLEWPEHGALVLMTVGSDSVRVWPPATLPFEVAVSYGSSEANGVSSCLVPWEDRCTSATASQADRRRPPPVGRPWPDVDALVLEPNLERVPPGAVGELCVASPELARGYLGDAASTAASFLPNPYGEPGGRLYRTGDLARLRSDGRLEHHGRSDSQVKIRGYRVEPAEVEAALLHHPAVTAAVVAAATSPQGQRQLAAYIVSRAPLAQEDLREFTAAWLPDYMVPRVYMQLDHLPLNANNKVDRGRLPAPDWTQATAERPPSVRPADALEEELLELWSQVLGAEGPSMQDNFFHSGGDSLSASSLIGRVRERFGIRVRLREFFLAPTPSALARRVRALLRPPAD